MIITLNDTEIKDIENFCLEMPTKYGLPIIQYLQELASKQNPIQDENKEN
jgi:hypothetical protein